LLRIALVLALVLTLACGVFLLIDRGGARLAAKLPVQPAAPSPAAPSPAASQVLLAGLESGACVSLAPKRAGSGQTVFIDAGHGGIDPGVVGGTSAHRVLEKDAALGVATRLSALLRDDGYRVVMARTRDSTVAKLSPNDSVLGSLTATAEHHDLVTRTACANAAGAAALVSIHFDAYTDPAVGGTGTFYNATRPFAAASRRLATDLQSALVAALATADRGVWTDDQIAAPTLTASGSAYGHLIELGPMAAGWVDDPSKMPGALVEPLFLTNPAEAQLAGDDTGQQRIAAALEAGLVKFLTGG
jgi:N-acetylmuramoyl-L-alanine amidase